MKKIVIFIITILVLGVLAMVTCVQNSKLIEKEKNKEQIATLKDEIIDIETDNKIQGSEMKKEESTEIIVAEDEIIKQEVNNSKSEIVPKVEKNTSNKKEEKTKIIEQEVVEKSENQVTTEVKEESSKEITTNENQKQNTNNIPKCDHSDGKWYNSKDEAIAVYDAEEKELKDKWLNYKITNEEYFKNRPKSYEILSCPYCNKWTINISY